MEYCLLSKAVNNLIAATRGPLVFTSTNDKYSFVLLINSPCWKGVNTILYIFTHRFTEIIGKGFAAENGRNESDYGKGF